MFLTDFRLLLLCAASGMTLNRIVPWELIWQEEKHKYEHNSTCLWGFIDWFPVRWPTSIWMTCSGSRPTTGFPFTSTNRSPGWRSPETHTHTPYIRHFDCTLCYCIRRAVFNVVHTVLSHRCGQPVLHESPWRCRSLLSPRPFLLSPPDKQLLQI